MDGVFSVKSDVFSFGVLVLEIITGKKNRGFYHSNSELNLLGHVSIPYHNTKHIKLPNQNLKLEIPDRYGDSGGTKKPWK